jgi:type IV secretion system protein VirD4
VIVNDIKGELYDQTAGYRLRLGPVFRFDPDGIGHRFDPLLTKQSEKDLLSAATHLLYRPDEREGRIFTERATVMLTQLFLAARSENAPLLPYVRQMVRLGLIGTAKHLFRISPSLATQFLDADLTEANFDDRFLLSAWGTLSARMRLLLTETVVRSFTGTDFTVSDIMRGKKPVTVYLCWPERDLLSLTPLVRLMWDCLVNELIHTFDCAKGDKCRPVLLLIDEAGTSPIPNLSRFSATVCGRGVSLWIAVQALSQLEALYGKHNAETIINNCDSQIYYRQSSQGTAEYLERSLGKESRFAHSQSTYQGAEKSQGLSEQAVPLMTAQEVKQLSPEDILGFFANRPPFKARRMDWRAFPALRERRAIPPPPLSPLPALKDHPVDRGESHPFASSWQLPPELTRRGRPAPAGNGLPKKGKGR